MPAMKSLLLLALLGVALAQDFPTSSAGDGCGFYSASEDTWYCGNTIDLAGGYDGSGRDWMLNNVCGPAPSCGIPLDPCFCTCSHDYPNFKDCCEKDDVAGIYNPDKTSFWNPSETCSAVYTPTAPTPTPTPSPPPPAPPAPEPSNPTPSPPAPSPPAPAPSVPTYELSPNPAEITDGKVGTPIVPLVFKFEANYSTPTVHYHSDVDLAFYGLNFNTQTGEISGTPTVGTPKAGPVQFTVSVHDSINNQTVYDSSEVKMTIADFPLGYVSYDKNDVLFKLPKLLVCDPKSNKLQVSALVIHGSNQPLNPPIVPRHKCGGTPTSFAIKSGALPGGLTLNAKTGAIGGIPNVKTHGPVEIVIAASNNQNTVDVAVKLVVAGNPNSRD